MNECRECAAGDLELTANGRVRTHPVDGEQGQPNCGGGSALPRGVDHEVIQDMRVAR